MHEHYDEKLGPDDAGRPERGSGRWIALAVVALITLIFVLQNRDRATVDFLFWDADIRIWFALAVAATLGVITGFIVGRATKRDRSK
jgi:uncharacterized integral membrane protein